VGLYTASAHCSLFIVYGVPETLLQYCAAYTVCTNLGGYFYDSACEAPGRNVLPFHVLLVPLFWD